MKALQLIYPDYHWLAWKFDQVPKGFWDDESNVMESLKCLSTELDIKTLDDWYNVTVGQIQTMGCSSLLKKYGGLHSVLAKFYPNHSWDINHRFRVAASKMQMILFKIVVAIFPDCSDIFMEYPHPALQYLLQGRLWHWIFLFLHFR